jgi:hypothetical protein
VKSFKLLLEDELHTKLKMKAAAEGTYMHELIVSVLEGHVAEDDKAGDTEKVGGTE